MDTEKQTIGYCLKMSSLSINASYGLEYLLQEGLTERTIKLLTDGLWFCVGINTDESKLISNKIINIIEKENIPYKKDIRELQRSIHELDTYLNRAFKLTNVKNKIKRCEHGYIVFKI